MRAPKLLLAAATAALISAAPSASRADVLGGVGTYFKDRFHDTLDLFRLRAGFPENGQAIGLKARATSLAQVGYVHFDGTYVGMDRRGVGIVSERRREGGVSVFYGSFNRMIPGYSNLFLKENSPWADVEDRRIVRNMPHWDDGRNRHLSIGAEFTNPLFGIDAGVYPEEALDLVLGFFVIDIFNDDELFGYDTNVYQRATTPPGPVTDAPFKAKQEANKAFMEEMELKAAMELVEAMSDAEEAMVDAPALPPVDEERGMLISEEAADAAMNELEKEAEAGVEVQEMAPQDDKALEENP